MATGGRRVPWTKTEEGVLRRLWDEEEDIEAIRDAFSGRSLVALNLKASEKGMPRLGKTPEPRYWTEERCARLADLWTTESEDAIVAAEFPDKAWHALSEKAYNLGLPRRDGLAPLPEIHLSSVEAAWIAGFIDGDGSINLFPNNDRSGAYRTYTPRIDVSNTREKAIAIFDSLFPGGAIRQKLSDGRRRPGFKWLTNRTSLIRAILVAVQPYLFIRREQADLLLRWIELRNASPLRGPYPHWEEEAAIFERLKGLNAKRHRVQTGGV